MKTEKEKMLAGELYDATDRALSEDRLKARLLLKALNDGREDEPEARARILKELLPGSGRDLWLQPPFYCDYGYNIRTGDRVFFNFNCVVLDVATVTIGSRTLFGPNVQIYTATHPMDAGMRATGLEFARPIVIGEDVWVGGSAVICPGVTIGDRTVIGAGSVVTKDIPADVLAAGNPCRVIRPLEGEERRGRGEAEPGKDGGVTIVPYTDAFQPHFRSLNEEWITLYFRMEAADFKALDHPREYILDRGGQIFVALYEGTPVGVCALIPMDGGGFELAKMAVSPMVQGRGIGYRLGVHVLERAKAHGAKKVYLESNTILEPAIRLYRKLGFREITGHPTPYERCNIQMERELTDPENG